MIVDASVWVALFFPEEKHHQEATLILAPFG